MDTRKPDAEVEVGLDLLRTLLLEQHPDLADEALSELDEGWDNVTFRIGTRWAARLPRRAAAVPLLLNEQRWLGPIAARVGVGTPLTVRVGLPAAGFPWPWSVVSWVDGVTADREPLGAGQGERLAAVLESLHAPAPEDAPRNPFRGVPLRARADVVADRLARIAQRGDRRVAALRRLWGEGLEAEGSRERVWLHGDLHPRNALVRDGTLVGLIDWGDLNGGDAATDVAAAWTLLRSETERDAFRDRYRPSHPLWSRARAWAVFFGAALATTGDPRHDAMGDAILRQLVHDDP